MEGESSPPLADLRQVPYSLRRTPRYYSPCRVQHNPDAITTTPERLISTRRQHQIPPDQGKGSGVVGFHRLAFIARVLRGDNASSGACVDEHLPPFAVGEALVALGGRVLRRRNCESTLN